VTAQLATEHLRVAGLQVELLAEAFGDLAGLRTP